MNKKRTKVIHLHFKELPTPETKTDYYFGSKLALCRFFGKDSIGLSYDTLKSYDILSKSYENKKCIINQGQLLTLGDI